MKLETKEDRQRWELLALLTLVNLFNYFDRYILVSVAPVIQREMGLTDVATGFLGTAFMLMYFATSPFFGWLGDRLQRPRLMSFGVGLWSLATAASGGAMSYAQLLCARAGVGIGEASYTAVSPPLLNDLFPHRYQGRVFAAFFMAIPVGSALGYLVGGVLEKHFGWRQAFFIAGVPGLLLALALLFMRDAPRGQFETRESSSAPLPLGEVLRRLWGNRVYLFTVAGYCAYTFVVGGVSFWMPSFLTRFHGLQLANANMIFGAVTVVAGLLGTFVGGFVADRWRKHDARADLKLSGCSMLIAAAVFVVVLLVSDFSVTMALIFALEFFLFLSTSPINAEVVNCVPVAYRTFANAGCVFLIHLLGDAWSPSLIGAISDRTDLKTALIIGPCVTLLAGALWLVGARRVSA